MKPTVVLVAGGTASGKTTIVSALIQQLEHLAPSLLTVDSYYFPLDHLNYEERDALNFDHPDVFEVQLLKTHLDELLSGREANTPIYDYALHNRKEVGGTIRPSSIIIIEGIMALHYPELRERADYKVFIEAPDSLRLERRIERDVRERGRTRESVLSWWDSKVHPMHLEFCHPSKEHADLTISGEIIASEAVSKIISKLQERGLLIPEI